MLIAQSSIGDNLNQISYSFNTKFFHHGQTNPFILIVIIILAIIFIGLEFYYKTPYFSLWNTFLSWNAISIEGKNATAYTLTRLFVYAFLGISISSFVTYFSISTLFSQPINLVVYIILAFIFQALLNYLSYIILDKIFSQSGPGRLLLLNFLYFWATLSEISFVFFVLLLFVNNLIIIQLIAVLWLFIFSIVFIRKAIILLKIFSDARFLLLHFILYFCAVELTPFLLIFTNIKN